MNERINRLQSVPSACYIWKRGWGIYLYILVWKPVVLPFPCLALLIFVSKHSSLPYWEEDLKWQCTGLPASFRLNALLVAHRQSVQTGKAFRVSTSVMGSESHQQASSLWFGTSNYRLFQSCGPLIIFLAHCHANTFWTQVLHRIFQTFWFLESRPLCVQTSCRRADRFCLSLAKAFQMDQSPSHSVWVLSFHSRMLFWTSKECVTDTGWDPASYLFL